MRAYDMYMCMYLAKGPWGVGGFLGRRGLVDEVR